MAAPLIIIQLTIQSCFSFIVLSGQVFQEVDDGVCDQVETFFELVQCTCYCEALSAFANTPSATLFHSLCQNRSFFIMRSVLVCHSVKIISRQSTIDPSNLNEETLSIVVLSNASDRKSVKSNFLYILSD